MEKKLGIEPSLFQVLWRRIIPLISGVALLSVMWFGSNTYYAGMFAGDEWIKAVGDRAVPSIMDAMEKLPEDQRQVILLRELEGLSYKEIAEVADIPEGTVMSRLFYARKKLQKLLADDRPRS